MNTKNQTQTDRLASWLSLFALTAAGAAGIISFSAYIGYFSHTGGDAKAVTLALFIAAAIGGGYAAVIHALLKGVARMPSNERAKLTPLIILIWLVVLMASAFPILIHAGKGEVTYASANAYISKVTTSSDELKAANLAFEQVGPVLDNSIATLKGLHEMESSGVFSGTRTQGSLSRWIGGFVERLRTARDTVTSASVKTNDLITDIDRTINRMRKALEDSELDLEGRKRALQKAGDELRSRMIALRHAAPVSALKNLAEGLRAQQIHPKLSANAKIRRGQVEGVRRISGELRKIGRDLERRVDDMAQALKVRIPAHETLPDSILVLSNLTAVPHIAMAALGLDTLPLILFLIIAAAL